MSRIVFREEVTPADVPAAGSAFVYLKADGLLYAKYDDGSEQVLSNLSGRNYYDPLLGFVGVPAASALDWLLVIRNLTVLAADPGAAYARAAASAEAIFELAVNGVAVGSVTLPAGAQVGTIALDADVVLVPGDHLELTAPDPADATLADLNVALKAAAA